MSPIMDLPTFKRSLAAKKPPSDLNQALTALWWDAKGEWDRAHDCAQKQEDAAGAWVHAYLHRKEGNLSNAGYWYRQAGKPKASGSLEVEWRVIAGALLRMA